MEHKQKILVVDDDVRLSQTLKLLLGSTGRFTVQVVNDPLKACAEAKRIHPDLIILDVIMPFMDGGTVAARIREEPSLAETPVIFLTSILDREEAAVKGNTIGNDPVLAKPVTTAELIAQIDAVFDKR